MTQHTNRFSQQQAIPPTWTALHENSTAVQPAWAWREGRLGVVVGGEQFGIPSSAPWVWAASPARRARGTSQCAVPISAIKHGSTRCGEM